METFTIHDMLLNSTELNKFLCNFGIKNISECEIEQNASPEPKGTVNLLFNITIKCYATSCRIATNCIQTFCVSFYLKAAVCAERTTAGGIFCVCAHYAYGSSPP